MDEPRIIVALDFASGARARAVAARLDPALCRLKVGKELFTREGPAIVGDLREAGFDVFLDLKFHDIPRTTAAACRAAADLGAWMINVHALGGARMLDAAREAIDSAPARPLLVAVTLLTSMDADALQGLGCAREPDDVVTGLASLAARAGLDGVVCSAREAAALRAAHGPGFRLVTPAIRPAPADDDQRRTTTPAAAIAAGADDLVIGRPVTAADDPAIELERIAGELRASD